MKLRFALGVALALLLAAPTGGAGAANVVNTQGETIVLDTGKGTLIRLDRPASTVFVAEPDIADVQIKSPRLLYLLGKKPGQTVIYAVDADDRILFNRLITVDNNLTRVRDALSQVMPEARIDVQNVDNRIVLSGTVNSESEANDATQLVIGMFPDLAPARVMNRLRVLAPNQVNLRVKIAEVSRDVLKQFAINWNTVFKQGRTTFGLLSGNPALLLDGFVGSESNANLAFGSYRSNPANVDAILDALEREGLVTILAEPNLTAVSGQTAHFLAGGEFPILVPQDESRVVTVTFKQFGVSLMFAPTLVDTNRISLRVKPEVSELSSAGSVTLNGFNIPALTTRRAETTVELGSGQSFAIAGLLQSNLNESLNKFPGLSDIPILGALFRSTRFQQRETELVIIVTPYIVRPTSAPMMAAPTDGLVAPSDNDRMVRGQLYRQNQQQNPQTPRGRAGNTLVGPSGFVIE
ncbi:MAG: type II and III secretion system protein family protein [Rhodospirillales bacterium]